MSRYSFEPQPECKWCGRREKPFCERKKFAKDCEDYIELKTQKIKNTYDFTFYNRVLEHLKNN